MSEKLSSNTLISTGQHLQPAVDLRGYASPFFINFVGQSEQHSKWRTTTRQKKLPLGDVTLYSVDFSRPFSLVVGRVTVQLFPGLIPELDRNKLNDLFEETAKREFHTVCFTSEEYRITDIKVNAVVPNFIQTQIEQTNTRCIFPLNSGSGLQLNYNTEFWPSRHKGSTIYIVLAPKLTGSYKLVILLNPEKHDPQTDSIDSLIEFVRIELNNSQAKFLPNLSSVVKGAVEFENEFEFSKETLKFIDESCKPNYRSSLFTLADATTYERMFGSWPIELKLFWKGSYCPVQTGFRLETESALINVEVSFTNQIAAQTDVKSVNSLPALFQEFQELNPAQFRNSNFYY